MATQDTAEATGMVVVMEGVVEEEVVVDSATVEVVDTATVEVVEEVDMEEEVDTAAVAEEQVTRDGRKRKILLIIS